MLTALSAIDAQRLREFLAEAHYTHEEFQKRRVLQELPKIATGNLPYLLEHFKEPSLANLLLRWYFLGVPAEADVASSLVPQPILTLMQESGMLVRKGSQWVPAIMLTPCQLPVEHTGIIGRHFFR